MESDDDVQETSLVQQGDASEDEDQDEQVVVTPRPRSHADKGKGRAKQSDTPASSTRKARNNSSRINGDEDDEGVDENDAPAVMSGSSRRKNKKRRIEAFQDDERDGAGSDGEERTSSSSRNRRAVESDAGEEEEDELLDGQTQQEDVKPLVRLARDPKDGYVMGSIVRIQCHNFRTYDDIVCRPGAHLNVIFGPNGSGKSTIASAIAIGLGFPPKLTGQTSDLKNFVREGCSEGWVEIELKGKPGKRDGNVIVRRAFETKSNSSKFHLNGEHVPHREVTEAVQELNINVDNLCSFLPQDRVAAFASMSGAELLAETQRVADPRLVQQQELLAKHKEQLLKSSGTLEKNVAEHAEKQRKLNHMEKDVKRHKEKQKIEEEAIILEHLFPFAKYVQLKAEATELKGERSRAKTILDELEDANRPLLEQRDNLRNLGRTAERRRKELVNLRDKATRDQSNLVRRMQGSEGEIEKMKERVNELREIENKRLGDIRECEKRIQILSKQLQDDPPPSPDDPELLAQLQEFGRKARAAKDAVTEIHSKHADVNKDLDAVAEEKRRVQASLAALDDVKKRRDNACAHEDRSLYSATQWMRNNSNAFKGTVFEPIRLLVQAKDKKTAKYAEAAINYATMKTFVCHEYKDYETLADTFSKFPADLAGRGRNSQGGFVDLRCNVAALPPEKRTLAAYPKPMSQEELQRWGFDCFAIDLVDGPETLLAYLCETSNLHRVPITFDDGRRIRHEDVLNKNSPFRRYITKDHISTITISQYGQNKAIVQDRQLPEARIFADSFDTAKKQELDLRMAEVTSQRDELLKKRDELIQEEQELRQNHEPIAAEGNALKAEKDRRRKACTDFARLGSDLTNEKNTLQALKAQPSMEEKQKQLATQTLKATMKRLKDAMAFQILGERLTAAHAAENTMSHAVLQAQANEAAVQNAVERANEEMIAASEAYKRAKELYTLKFAAAKEVYAQAEGMKAALPPNLVEQFDGRLERMVDQEGSADAISQKAMDLRNQLEMISNVNPEIVRKYETLKREVHELAGALENHRESVKRAKHTIDKIHARWFPQVQKIVQTVGANFSRNMGDLGCLGEIKIAEDEDYSKWAIKILVAFRDKEALTELTAQRQSGGERSLSTMLYLISLLEASRTPFSLVDEINQGMDSRAERAVHNQLVQAVCDTDEIGQFFLITPKLLTNLKYHERIKILCVNNGDWLPDRLPLRSIISNQLRIKRGDSNGNGSAKKKSSSSSPRKSQAAAGGTGGSNGLGGSQSPSKPFSRRH